MKIKESQEGWTNFNRLKYNLAKQLIKNIFPIVAVDYTKQKKRKHDKITQLNSIKIIHDPLTYYKKNKKYSHISGRTSNNYRIEGDLNQHFCTAKCFFF